MSTELQLFLPHGSKASELTTLLSSDKVRPSLIQAATQYLDPMRIGPLFSAAALKDPKILKSTTPSIIDAALTCSRLGLEPGDRGVYLVPYEIKNTGTYTLTTIIDYKGLIQLAYRSGMVEGISAEVVYENDYYEVEYGIFRRLVHRPAIKDRGKPIAAYATCTLTNGKSGFVLMIEDEILKRRPNYTKKPGSIWDKHPMAMWKKTAVHELSKWIPITPEMVLFNEATRIIDTVEVTPIAHSGGVTAALERSESRQIATEDDAIDATYTEQPNEIDTTPSLLDFVKSKIRGAATEESVVSIANRAMSEKDLSDDEKMEIETFASDRISMIKEASNG